MRGALWREPGVSAPFERNRAVGRNDHHVAHERLRAFVDAQLAVAIGEGRDPRFDGEVAGAFARRHEVLLRGRGDENRCEAGHAGDLDSAWYFLRSTFSSRWSRLINPGPEKKSQRKLSA